MFRIKFSTHDTAKVKKTGELVTVFKVLRSWESRSGKVEYLVQSCDGTAHDHHYKASELDKVEEEEETKVSEKQSEHFELGDKVKIIKRGNFFHKELHIGMVGTVMEDSSKYGGSLIRVKFIDGFKVMDVYIKADFLCKVQELQSNITITDSPSKKEEKASPRRVGEVATKDSKIVLAPESGNKLSYNPNPVPVNVPKDKPTGFTKDDLQLGMKVVSHEYVVGDCLPEWDRYENKYKICIFFHTAFGKKIYLDEYYNDLTCDDENFNIRAVYKPTDININGVGSLLVSDVPVWQRTKKMSLSDIEKALGYPVEIIED